ncbi:hypothetical protein HP062_03855 [Pseudomonas sp. B14-6]|uniref:hypothetical protein n=1 Tax=Pseudomonas sp. B14-6 TaxID=2738843 RepID=UPI00155F2148|nr:hypothetical protein [Pseudomonas sp. B14-6]QKG64792.1 hypothetical protein HP062_03855 [Pseudomonas sp. B14-6]
MSVQSDRTTSTSEASEKAVIGSGRLKVMGARSNPHLFGLSGTSRLLRAFDTLTGEPVVAQWKYATDSDWTTAHTWRDTQQQALHVRVGDDQVILNSANIIGSWGAFVARTDDGALVGWGHPDLGAAIPADTAPPNDIAAVSATSSAFAALRADGTVAVWGDAGAGGNMGGISSSDFVEVSGGKSAFAGIKNTGQVVAWGRVAKCPSPSAR